MFTKDINYSQNLEMAILGACMMERSAFGRTFGIIEAECFYWQSHKEIYLTLKEMYEAGIPIDTFTVVDYLVRKQGFENFHGHNVPYFICHLTHCVVSTANLEYHCQVIKTMWIEREIISLTHGSIKLYGDHKNQIYDLQKRLQELNNQTVQSDWMDMSQLMIKLYQHQDEMQKKGGMGITTGILKLDHKNGGFHPGQSIVIGARTSMGKSALAGQMMVDMAKSGFKTGIISLEMNNVEIAARMAAVESGIDFDPIYRGLMKDESEKHRLYNHVKEMAHLPIYVTDKTGVNIHEIRAKAEKLKHSSGLDCLFIDYLQLVQTSESKNRNRENEISAISRGVKIMAKEMNIPVIEVCQLNREVTKRKGQDRYPQLSDLRESGSIEQDADVVMFLHRDWMMGHTENQDGSSTEHEADLVIRKWRNGVANWIIKLDFDGPTMKFTERRESKFIPVKISEDPDELPFN